MKKLAIGLCALILLAACSKEVDDPKPNMSFQIDEAIDFSDLRAGQKAAYLFYQGDCSDIQSSLRFEPDTLILEVAPGDEGRLEMLEYFSEYSQSYIEGWQDVTRYEVRQDGDVILLPNRGSSRMFWFYANDSIFIDPSASRPLRQRSCLLELESSHVFIGNDIGRLDAFQIGDASISTKFAVSCVPPILDLDAYLIYDEHGLSASHQVLSNNSFTGWWKLEL